VEDKPLVLSRHYKVILLFPLQQWLLEAPQCYAICTLPVVVCICAHAVEIGRKLQLLWEEVYI